MGTLSSLLRWKKSLTLKDEKGASILDEQGKPVTVWVRIISDKDLEDAFRHARIASAKMRANLLDETTEDHQALVAPFDSASWDQCYDMALAGMGANWMGEAISTVVRPDLVKISEIALDPDAPTLEEQEKVDAKNKENEEKYQAKLMEFIETKTTEAKGALESKDIEELRETAKQNVIITVPLEVFLNDLQDQKISRAVYSDEKCTIRGFESVEDYRSTVTVIKNQLLEAYEELEAAHSNIKN